MSPRSQPTDSLPSVIDVFDRVRRHPWKLLVGGALADAEADARYDVITPLNEDVVGRVPNATPGDVDRAVLAALDAARNWRDRHPRERVAALNRLADALEEHEDELALLDAIDSGNPISSMRGDVRSAAASIRGVAEYHTLLTGQTIPASSENLHYTVREPYGVVARIVPFNHPILFAASKIAAPIVAGNAVVLKPSDATPLSALRLGELCAEVLEPGLVNVVTGAGPEAGRVLVRHPAVRRIAFTGSEITGRAVQRDAADVGVKHVSLELGGKNAMVVFPDVDVSKAAAAAVRGMNFFWCQGQSCGSTSRILVHEDILAEMLAEIVREAEQIRIGSPLDPETEMGTLATRAQYEKALGYIALAREEGAEVLTGGGPPAALAADPGLFVAPTVLCDVAPTMRVAQEEIFGPVMSVISWSDADDVMAIANGVRYGLTAAIWTNDIATAHRAARAVEAGYVWINGSSDHFFGTPFGGYKASGIGKEESADEVLSYTEIKTVHVMLN